MDVAPDGHGPGGNGGIADALGQSDQVGRDAKEFTGGVGAQAAKAGDHFVKNQQDAMLFGDGAQFFQIALGRDQYTGGAGQRFDDDGGDGRCVMQGDDPFQVIGKMLDPFGFAARVGILGQVVGMGQVIDPG